jgi:hypothetical protein
MRSLDDLREEARYGTLTDVELEYIANRLKYFDPEKEDDSTLCRLLRIIEESDYQDVIIGKREKPRAIKYRHLIEPYLEYPRWGFVSAVVLQTLCQSTWGFTEDYLEIIRKFIEGVEWDTFNDCAICAISEAGEYLSKKTDEDLEQKDFELAQLSKSITDDPTHSLTDCAYRAFARAIGVPWNELFSFPNQEKKENSVNNDSTESSVQGEE